MSRPKPFITLKDEEGRESHIRADAVTGVLPTKYRRANPEIIGAYDWLPDTTIRFDGTGFRTLETVEEVFAKMADALGPDPKPQAPFPSETDPIIQHPSPIE